MAYLQHSNWRDRPGAVIGVIAIHAVIGYALINGLKFTQVFQQPEHLQGTEIEVPLDPPPPPPQPEAEADPAITDRPITVPLPPLPLPAQPAPFDTTTDILPPLDPVIKGLPEPTPRPSATPSPKVSPVGARPRGNPGNWVTTSDYRSSWIARELVGTAGFRLDIAADGRVQNCTINRSSGSAELDRATCDLVSRRARFEPARDETGATTAGTYASAVTWELPE